VAAAEAAVPVAEALGAPERVAVPRVPEPARPPALPQLPTVPPAHPMQVLQAPVIRA
jgi:hypothetical protein